MLQQEIDEKLRNMQNTLSTDEARQKEQLERKLREKREKKMRELAARQAEELQKKILQQEQVIDDINQELMETDNIEDGGSSSEIGEDDAQERQKMEEESK